MKQFFLIFAFLIGYCMVASAEKVKLVPSVDDSTRMDTVIVSELSDVNDATYNISDSIFDDEDIAARSITFVIISTIIVCGLPIFIVIITLWFRYKNKQAKYKLAAEALAAGQSIPKELFNEADNQHNDVLNKGIKNIFLGIGLGVFLWILSEQEGLAAIGFLVFCMGLGQVLIAYTTRPKKKEKE